jgi:hypothetical protein
MGQAFDPSGDFLGSVEAESASEVLKKLQEAHPHASEFRIKTLEERLNEKDAEIRKAIAQQKEQSATPGLPAPDRMLQFFIHAHLPDHVAKVSLPFCQLAEEICATLPGNPERTVALRKLLEAKDCAVRALLYK